LYGSETWFLSLREKHILRVFESRVLSRVFGPGRDRVARCKWEGGCMLRSSVICALPQVLLLGWSVPGALSLGAKQLGCGANHSPKVKNTWRYTSTPWKHLHGVVLSSKHRDNILYFIIIVENNAPSFGNQTCTHLLT